MENLLEEPCPCRRVNCSGHGDCEACREHHRASGPKPPTCCEKLERDEKVVCPKRGKDTLTHLHRKAKKAATVLLAAAVILAAVFLAGRYGWKLGGFRACQGAGITAVEVGEKTVHITGFYPGSFPEGFCGCYAKEQDGKLYVGFRFSAVFGFFETGDFDVTIPLKGEIDEVVLKTSRNETPVWNAQAGLLSRSE